MIKSLFKHSGVFFFGSLISKVVTTLVWILLARVLSPEKYGQFTLYFMLMQFVTFLADFGLNQYYLKSVEELDRKYLFNKVLFVRTATMLVSIVIIVLILFYFNIFDFLVSLLFVLSMIPMAYLSVTDGFYLEQKKGFRVSFRLASIGIIFLLGFVIFFKDLSLFTASILLLFSLLLTFAWFFPWKEIKLIKISFSEIFSILNKSSSYAFLTFTSFFYNKGDSLIISYFKGNTALGIYGLAYRFLESLSLFPSSLVQNLFPISAKKTGISNVQLKKISAVMFLLGLIFAVVVFLLSSLLIGSLFQKDYWQAIPILKIFSLVILLFFVNAPLATVIQSSHLVKLFLPYGMINTFFNILLNILFVPIFGIIAAAWVMVITELTGLMINIYFVKKLYLNNHYNTM